MAKNLRKESTADSLRRKWGRNVQKNLGKGLLRSTHWLAGAALKKAGYQFEVRRSGESKIGLWRKHFRPTPVRGTKRFVLLPGWGDSPLSWLTVLSLLYSDLRKHYDEIVVFDYP